MLVKLALVLEEDKWVFGMLGRERLHSCVMTARHLSTCLSLSLLWSFHHYSLSLSEMFFFTLETLSIHSKKLSCYLFTFNFLFFIAPFTLSGQNMC